MKEFETSLLREKFVITDADTTSNTKPTIALSNRLVVELSDNKGDKSETFTVRAHNMHLCVRMSVRILQSFEQYGPLLNRASPFDWEKVWNEITQGYEHSYNTERWVAVFHEGKPVFASGDRHPFLDLIEKCDFQRNEGSYDDSIQMAENAFQKTGKTIEIDYDGNVALVVHMEKNHAKMGVILRSPQGTTTFSYSCDPKDNNALSYAQCLSSSAAFLEGIQLAFLYGMNQEKIKKGIIERHSKEETQTREAGNRLQRLNSEIENLEATFNVHYRPERPQFHHIVNDSEKLAEKMLKDQT